MEKPTEAIPLLKESLEIKDDEGTARALDTAIQLEEELNYDPF